MHGYDEYNIFFTLEIGINQQILVISNKFKCQDVEILRLNL